MAICNHNYSELHKQYITNGIAQANIEADMWKHFPYIATTLVNPDNTKDNKAIAKELGIAVESVEGVGTRSINTLVKLKADGDGLKKKEKSAKDRIKWLQNRNVDEDIWEYLDTLKGRVPVGDD